MHLHINKTLLSISLLLVSFASGQEDGTCINGDCPSSDVYEEVYQDVWDADQSLNGIPPILPSGIRDEKIGFVVVQEPENGDGDESLNIFPEVVVPQAKQNTYNLVKALFDNYTLDQSKPESPQTRNEKDEIIAFINAIKDTAPMKVARQFIDSETGVIMTDTEWYERIDKLWFEIYEFNNSTPQRSGFEHVFVGEKNGSNLGGYHFWWKYYLDDKAVPGYADGKDNMRFLGSRYRSLNREGVANPYVVTLSHSWDAFDYENNKNEKINKRIGGFLVGCSPEGLIALGMVAFYDPRRSRTFQLNNGSSYEMKLFKAGENSGSINTFYAIFTGLAEVPTGPPTAGPPTAGPPTVGPPTAGPPTVEVPSKSDVRIIAALVNPEGEDQDNETVTLLNASNRPINLEGWSIAGNNGNAYKLTNTKLDAGEVRTFTLPAKDAQLVNKSGKITLTSATGEVADLVDYEKKDIKSGFTIVF